MAHHRKQILFYQYQKTYTWCMMISCRLVLKPRDEAIFLVILFFYLCLCVYIFEMEIGINVVLLYTTFLFCQIRSPLTFIIIIFKWIPKIGNIQKMFFRSQIFQTRLKKRQVVWSYLTNISDLICLGYIPTSQEFFF